MRTFPALRWSALSLLSFALVVGCSSSSTGHGIAADSGAKNVGPGDTGLLHDVGAESSVPDSGQDATLDSGVDTGFDSGSDTGFDGGMDTAVPEAGSDTSESDAPADTSAPDAPADSPISTIFTVGGSITGTSGATVVLQDNGGDNLTLSADGMFTFATPLASGAAYLVTVSSSPGLTCTVTDGTGTVASANVTSVVVTCVGVSDGGDGGPIDSGAPDTATVTDSGTPDSPVVDSATPDTSTPPDTGSPVDSASADTGPIVTTVGGNVTGLPSGSQLTLEDNAANPLNVAGASGSVPFTFSNVGPTYDVTIKTQPTDLCCTVTGGSGMATGQDVTSVAVSCASCPVLKGSLSGLGPNDSVELLLNGGDGTFLGSNGTFSFSSGLAIGTPYTVTVASNPAVPIAQTCTVTNGSGTYAAQNPTVVVTCVTNTYTVGGWVILNGVPAETVTLDNNGGNTTMIQGKPGMPVTFTFSTPIPSATGYDVVATAAGATCTGQPVGTNDDGVTAENTASGAATTSNISAILFICQ